MSLGVKYQPEIDGLRTIAVLAVVLFHLNPESLKGGFLGVDVFFVISGYLITSIIAKQVNEGQFSLWSFWKRRFKRLYPALTFMVLVSLIIGFLVLPQPDRGGATVAGAWFAFLLFKHSSLENHRWLLGYFFG